MRVKHFPFSLFNLSIMRFGKTDNKKRATSLQYELNSDVVRFTTHKKQPCNHICCTERFERGLA